jgi:hypothetical protein
VGTRRSIPGIKWPGREANQTPPSSAEVMNRGAITPLPPDFFMVWSLIK